VAAPLALFFGGVLLVSLSSLLLLRSVWRDAKDSREVRQGRLAQPALLVGGLGLYALLLEFMGYPLMTTLIAILVLRVLDTPWMPAVVVSVLLALGSFALFVKLGVPLPTGQVFGG
jgi:Tripartite tricarboxylate transporter TctB family